MENGLFLPNADTEKDEQRIYRGFSPGSPGKDFGIRENWEELLRKVLDMIEWVYSTNGRDRTGPRIPY
jgi:hypothetical protein